jgi:hypothetical protein
MLSVEITIKGRDLISAKGYSTSNLRHLSRYGRLRLVSLAGNGAKRAPTVAPWAVTSAAHREGLPVLGSQQGSRLPPRNDMENPVVLSSIGGRWRRRGTTRRRLGLGISPSRGGGSDALPSKVTSSAAPGGFGSPS